MKVTCPCCRADFPIEAGFAEADGKRLAALMAEFEPVLGRATLSYLRLFKPAKTALQMAKAVRIVQELDALVRVGTVCTDERSGIRRPATPAVWAAGIDQMLHNRGSLTLPLDGHNYLRKVVFGLADAADAKAEQAREADARAGRHLTTGVSPKGEPEDKLRNQLAWLRSQLEYGQINQAEHDLQVAAARAKLSGGAA